MAGNNTATRSASSKGLLDRSAQRDANPPTFTVEQEHCRLNVHVVLQSVTIDLLIKRKWSYPARTCSEYGWRCLKL